MVSTNFNAPPLKLTLLAIGAVVVLHVLTAAILAMVQTPAPIIKPLELTPPIEIELMTPIVKTEEPEITIEKVAPIPVKKSQPLAKAKPAEKPKPVAAPPVKSIKKVAPKPKEAPKTKPSPQPAKVIEKEPIVTTTVEKKITPIITADSAAADERRRISAMKTRADADAKARTEAAQQAQADREAQAIAKAKVEQAAQAQAAANAQAAKEAAERAAQQQAAAAASNAPANFTANNASWASKPRFEFPRRAERSARPGDTLNVGLSLRVNKQGGIESVSLVRSSGNPTLDKEAQSQVRSGKFKPFTKDGVPRVGNVTFTVSYEVPS